MAAVAARNVLQAPKSAAHKKYENYKVATSLAEARRLGTDTRSLTWDLQRGCHSARVLLILAAVGSSSPGGVW